MGYGYQHAVFHAIKAVALFGLFIAAALGLIASIQFMADSANMTPQELEEVAVLFEVAGYGLLAVMVWSIVELMAAAWSISYVRRAAGWARTRVEGVVG